MSTQQAARKAEQAALRAKERRRLVVIAVVVVLAVVGGGVAVQAFRANRAPSASPAGDTANFPPVTIAAGEPIRLGRAGAPVTLSLWEDFHCPHCADFEEEMGPMIAEAQRIGSVMVELYPVSFIDDGSASAANAMACAAEAGFGPAYYTGLFANHTLRWSHDQLLDLAEQVTENPPAPSFTSCVTGGKHQDWAQSMNDQMLPNNIAGTPTMFIDGERVDITGLTPVTLKALISGAQE